MSSFDRRTLRRRQLLLAAPASLWSACASDASKPTTTTPTPVGEDDIDDVIYRPGTTDEGLLVLLNAPPVTRTDARPLVTAPEDGAVLAGPTTFEYRAGTTALHPRRTRRGRSGSFFDWLVLERTAFAHGTPMNGAAFFLVFATSGNEKLLRLFTTEASYVPTDDEWQRLAGAGETISFGVTHGVFEENRLTADGGPFSGPVIRFTIAP